MIVKDNFYITKDFNPKTTFVPAASTISYISHKEEIMAYYEMHNYIIRCMLNEEEKRLLKLLCKCGSNPLIVKAIKVPLQKENECGPLAFELAQKFCFYRDEGRLNSKVNNSRKHLLSCLKANKIIDLQLEFEGEPEIESVLFSYYI